MMFFKTSFVLLALFCLSNARPQEHSTEEEQLLQSNGRPQEQLTEEEQSALGALYEAIDEFFMELWKYIEYILEELEHIFESWTEDDELDKDAVITELDESISKLKQIEEDAHHFEENLIDGKLSRDPETVVPIGGHKEVM